MANSYQICFPVGGCGNHIRWLLFLDETVGNMTLNDKLNFIKTKIYTADRACFNWFQFEGKFNELIKDGGIKVHHDVTGWEQDPFWVLKSILYLSYDDIQNPLNHIYHLLITARPTISGSFSAGRIRDELQAYQRELELISASPKWSANKKIVNASSIFDPRLDRRLYSEVISYFGFADHYEEACEVHKLYYNCRINAAREFYKMFTEQEFYNCLEFMKELGDVNG